MQSVCDYWLEDYDWSVCEYEVNTWGQFTTTIDGVEINFVHKRSPHDDAMPLILTHGWPGSIIEFHKVIEPLTDPVAHGGDAADAFHLVMPSLPGYGWSGKPTEPGWGIDRVAQAWATLMARLGYDRYCAQGGDWGAMITAALPTTMPTTWPASISTCRWPFPTATTWVS